MRPLSKSLSPNFRSKRRCWRPTGGGSSSPHCRLYEIDKGIIRIGSVATHPHCEERLRRSNPGATTCAAPATQTVVLRPLDCFASLAMTDRELAHMFLRVA